MELLFTSESMSDGSNPALFISCKYKYPESLVNMIYGKHLQFCAVQVRSQKC